MHLATEHTYIHTKILNTSLFSYFNRGSEFVSQKQFFKDNKIFWRARRGANKAAIAELSIKLIKNKMFRLLRDKRVDDWPSYVEDIVKSLNNTPKEAIGFLKPSQISSSLQDADIERARKKVGFKKEEHWPQWVVNQQNYERSKNPLQVNAYVFTNFNKDNMHKGYDYSVGAIYQIARVDARYKDQPTIYFLKDLMGEKLPGSFYSQELILTEKPAENEFFTVDKILKTKKVKQKKYFLVHYAF